MPGDGRPPGAPSPPTSGLRLLLGYQRSWLRPDLVAGLTVGAMLIPQAMAYAELAGLPPQHGFYAVVAPLVVYAAVGTSRHLGVGPEPGTALLAASGVGAIAGGDPGRYATLMAALALVVGAICVAAALARLGFLASLLSKPVLVGYITGVGLTLVTSQLASATGAPIEGDDALPRLRSLLGHLGDVHGTTLALTVATLALILALRRWAPKVPGALVGVVLGGAVVAVLGADDLGVALVGTVPGGQPVPGLPDVGLDELTRLLPVAAGIALVGYTDNVLTARSIAGRHGYRIDPNRELLALGLVNATSGVWKGFPISSSASRTAVPASLGSRTPAVSLVAAGFVVASVLGLRPLLAEIPRPALAAVILVAAIAIIDVAGYRALWRVSRAECALAVAAAAGVVVLGVLTGVLVAVGLSLAVTLDRIARPHDAVLGDEPSSDGWVDLDAHPHARPEPGLVVYRFDAPLFFGNVDRFRERVVQALADNPGDEEWVVLDFEGIGMLDATALDGLAELADELAALGIAVVAVTRANADALVHLRRAGLLAPEGPLRSYATIRSATAAFRARPSPPEVT